MSNSSAPNFLGSDAEKSTISITKHYKGYVLRFSNGASFPLLALPQDFNNYIFSQAAVSIGGKDILIPEINRILTEYCNECLQAYFTIEFVELVNQQSFPSNFALKDERTEYAVNLYILIGKLSPSVNDGEIRGTLAFYLGSPFNLTDLLNQSWRTSLTNLKKSLEPTAKRYFDRLAQIDLPNQKPPVNSATSARNGLSIELMRKWKWI